MRYLLIMLVTFWSQAQGVPSVKEGNLLRDAEMECILKSYITPLFEQAKLDPKSLHLYLIHTSVVNAAATIGNVILMNTGLLMNAKNAEEVIGVLAHETAHLEGGHVMRLVQKMDDMMLPMIIGMLAGVAAGIASQDPGAGSAILLGAGHLGERNMLRFTRMHEGAADAGAIRYLNALNWPTKGMAAFMERLNGNELIGGEPTDPYAITHPLSHDRVEFFRHETDQNQGTGSLPADFENSFLRLKTKIEAFTKPVGQVLLNHKGDSELDRYARAIAHYRRSDFDEALKVLDGLIKENPENPFYVELKGQILFDQGKVSEAIPLYKQVITMRPELSLVRILYAQALIESGNPGLFNEAKEELLRAKQDEKDADFLWRLLSVVYGKEGQMGLSALSLAEMNITLGQYEEALVQAKRAEKLLAKDPANLIRAKELIEYAEAEKKLAG